MRQNRISITGSTLKILACISMLIDHIGASLIRTYRNVVQGSYPALSSFLYKIYPISRGIGRLAFPIFCFLLVEGFLHTRSKRKYAFRMLLFCFISEIPFDYALSGKLISWGHQNVYVTLFLGLVAMIGISYFDYKPAESDSQRLLYFLMEVLVAAGCMYLAKLLKTDYSYKGVFSILLFYFLRSDKRLQTIFGAIIFSWESTAPLAFIPIWLYNGERGLKLKYFFYWFYPAHLCILGICRHMIIPLML